MKSVASKMMSDAPKHLGGARLDLQGINVTVGEVLTVEMTGITLFNMEGFTSEHMVHIDTFSVTVGLLDAIKSAIKRLGKPGEIEIIAVNVNGSVLIYEKSLTTSNVKSLIDTLAHKEAQDGEGANLMKAFETVGFKDFDPAALLGGASSKFTGAVQSAQELTLSDVAMSSTNLVKGTSSKIIEVGSGVATTTGQVAIAAATTTGQVAITAATTTGQLAKATASAIVGSHAATRPKKVPQILVRQVHIDNTHGNMVTTFTQQYGLPPLPLHFKSIRFEDFSAALGELSPSGVIAIILSKLLQVAMQQDATFYKVRDAASSTCKNCANCDCGHVNTGITQNCVIS